MTQYSGDFSKSWTSGPAVAGSAEFAVRAVPGINQLRGEEDPSVLLLDSVSLRNLFQSALWGLDA